MNKKDLVDIYDENKNKTGKIKIRHEEVLVPGEYIVGVQAIIINSNKQILISQRSPLKTNGPLKWECNGGAVLAGENFIDGLIREIYEELGITLLKDNAIFLKSVKKEHNFKEIYLFKKDIEISELNFADGEAISAKWVDIEEFINMYNNGDIVDNVDFNKDDYKSCLLLLEEIN